MNVSCIIIQGFPAFGTCHRSLKSAPYQTLSTLIIYVPRSSFRHWHSAKSERSKKHHRYSVATMSGSLRSTVPTGHVSYPGTASCGEAPPRPSSLPENASMLPTNAGTITQELGALHYVECYGEQHDADSYRPGDPPTKRRRIDREYTFGTRVTHPTLPLTRNSRNCWNRARVCTWVTHRIPPNTQSMFRWRVVSKCPRLRWT